MILKKVNCTVMTPPKWNPIATTAIIKVIIKLIEQFDNLWMFCIKELLPLSRKNLADYSGIELVKLAY